MSKIKFLIIMIINLIEIIKKSNSIILIQIKQNKKIKIY